MYRNLRSRLRYLAITSSINIKACYPVNYSTLRVCLIQISQYIHIKLTCFRPDMHDIFVTERKATCHHHSISILLSLISIFSLLFVKNF